MRSPHPYAAASVQKLLFRISHFSRKTVFLIDVSVGEDHRAARLLDISVVPNIAKGIPTGSQHHFRLISEFNSNIKYVILAKLSKNHTSENSGVSSSPSVALKSPQMEDKPE